MKNDNNVLGTVKRSAKTGTGVFIVLEGMSELSRVGDSILQVAVRFIWKIVHKIQEKYFGKTKKQQDVEYLPEAPSIRYDAGVYLTKALMIDKIIKERK